MNVASLLQNYKPIMFYVRGSRGRRVGLLVALKDAGTVRIGWSKWNKSDRYNKNLGLQIALDRALSCKGVSRLAANAPHEIRKNYDEFLNRAAKYFHVDPESVCNEVCTTA